MAFDDNPIVDRHAERSQESVLKTQLWFSKKNGFIPHLIDGSDDYGVDIMCQLTEKGEALSFNFPIQIKSKKSYSEIEEDGELFKAFSFVTSRLGYLVRHVPYAGLVVIYEEDTQQLFFETVLELFNRVRESHDDLSWKKQHTVTLHIPSRNVVDKDNIQKLHTEIVRHFRQNNQLIIDHGSSYNIPAVDTPLETDSTVSFLIKYGQELFDANMYHHLSKVLQRLTMASVNTKEIVYLSAITYVETGNLIDADYFSRLCDKHISQFTADQKDLLNAQRFRLEYYLGKKSTSELKSMLENSTEAHLTASQRISLKLNLLNLDLLNFIPDEQYDEKFISSIERTLGEVEASDQPNTIKQYQFMYLSDLLGRAVSGILTQMFLNTKISESLGVSPQSPERQKRTERIQYLNRLGLNYLIDARKFAQDTNNDLLEAFAKYYLALSFFGNLRSYQIANRHWEENPKEYMELIYADSIDAYTYFNRKGMRPLASKAIYLALEINLLADLWAGFNLDSIAKRSQIEKILSDFEGSDFRVSRQSLVVTTHEFIKGIGFDS